MRTSVSATWHAWNPPPPPAIRTQIKRRHVVSVDESSGTGKNSVLCTSQFEPGLVIQFICYATHSNTLQAPFIESNEALEALNQLKTDDTVDQLRDTYAADLVQLIGDFDTNCGVG